MPTKNRTIWMNCIIVFIFINSSILIAQNAEITIEGGASITLTANGEYKSYLINSGDKDGEIIVNSGASLTIWSLDALIDFTVSGEGDFSFPAEDTIPPNPPQNLTAQSGDKQVTLTWATNSEPDFLRYRIYGNTSPIPVTRIDSTNSINETTKTIVGLSNGTKYYFRITAIDSSLNESDYSNEVNSTPSSGTIPPSATTNAATNLSSTSATLNGSVNPNSLSTTVKFEYGTTQSYGNEITAIQSPVSGSSAVSVSAELTGLAPNTTYHFRVVATNSAGTTNGSDQTFTTSANAPAVTTDAASNVSTTSATLNGTINPNGLSTTVKFEYGKSQSYGNEITASQSPVNGSSAVAVTAELASLAPNTIYHYRIVATNSAGTTTGSNQAFTTSANAPAVTTNLATNVSTTAATLNGSVNPNSLSTTVKFEYGTSMSYGSEILARQSPVTGASVVPVDAELTGLIPNTTYYYRVVATNSAGTTTGSNQSFTTSAIAPTVMTEAATIVGETSCTLNGSVNPNGLSTTVKFEYGTTASYGSEVTAMQSPVSGSSPVNVSAQITNLLPNTGYHYRVVATNSAGATQGSDQTFTTELPAYPASLSVNSTVSFPNRDKASDYKTTDYRILGLPGASNRPITDFLDGSHNKDWQLYWHNGSEVVEYDGSSVFNFSVGRAFWVIKKDSLNVNTNVPSAALNGNKAVEIPLHAGWNLITNPFTSSLVWSNIQSANSLSEPIWSYQGSFNQSSDFEPYFGYFLFNGSNLSSLKIPYSLLFSKSLAAEESNSNIWQISIKLTAGEFIDQSIWFGASRMASSGLDPLDLRKPETVAFAPKVYFPRSQWDDDYSVFASDIRPEFNESRNWQFEVQTLQRIQVKLVFSGIESVPALFEVFLIDEAKAKGFNLRENSLYSFTPAAEISRFNIVVGKTDAVNERLKSVIPKEFALGKNYPNPFNPTTNLPLAIPYTSKVEIVVYNILGEKIKTIYTGELEAGQYLFSWDGRDDSGSNLASGVYIYCLKTTSRKTLAEKMILLK